MPQNWAFLKDKIGRNVSAPATLKSKPGILTKVICLQPGTINIINDVTPGGSGGSITGFPATMVAGQVLPINLAASVGISVASVTGVYNVVFN